MSSFVMRVFHCFCALMKAAQSSGYRVCLGSWVCVVETIGEKCPPRKRCAFDFYVLLVTSEVITVSTVKNSFDESERLALRHVL